MYIYLFIKRNCQLNLVSLSDPDKELEQYFCQTRILAKNLTLISYYCFCAPQ